MSGEFERIGASRRSFLKAGVLGAGAAAALRTGGEATGETAVASPSAPLGVERDGPLFDAAERSALAALAELVLPGAGTWGAVDYVERTLTLFDSDPPRLYAGTVGSTDEWLPFDRVREHAWRLRIYGSSVVDHPNEAVLGPVPGHRPVIVEGARAAVTGFEGGASARAVWGRLSDDFHGVFTELVLEGSLGDPIYGGNREGAAWRAFHFEGAMLGYASSPVRSSSHAHHAAQEENPDPLGLFTRIALWAMGFLSRRIA